MDACGKSRVFACSPALVCASMVCVLSLLQRFGGTREHGLEAGYTDRAL